MSYKEVIFDVETKKLFNEITTDNPADLGVSIVSVYIRTVDSIGKELSGEMRSFWELDFPSMWEYFTTADRIIGFNTLWFDVPALKPYTQIDLTKLKHFDLMDKFKQATGRRISLNSLATTNLDTHKVDSGTNAVMYWKQGDSESLAKLKYYCEADVALTRDLYDLCRKQRHLVYNDQWNTRQTVMIDCSYPPPPDTQQMGLF